MWFITGLPVQGARYPVTGTSAVVVTVGTLPATLNVVQLLVNVSASGREEPR